MIFFYLRVTWCTCVWTPQRLQAVFRSKIQVLHISSPSSTRFSNSTVLYNFFTKFQIIPSYLILRIKYIKYNFQFKFGKFSSTSLISFAKHEKPFATWAIQDQANFFLKNLFEIGSKLELLTEVKHRKSFENLKVFYLIKKIKWLLYYFMYFFIYNSKQIRIQSCLLFDGETCSIQKSQWPRIANCSALKIQRLSWLIFLRFLIDFSQRLLWYKI